MILSFSSRRADRQAAECIYSAAVRAARRPDFYLECGVPDTLQGRFEMIALNLFIVLYRLMHSPGDDPNLARLVSEALVVDMDGAFREMGVGDLSVPKRMRSLYRSFAGRVSAYKAAVEDGEAAIAAALSRNVFPDGTEDRHVLLLSAYLRESVAAMRAADLSRLRNGDLPYPDVVSAG